MQEKGRSKRNDGIQFGFLPRWIAYHNQYWNEDQPHRYNTEPNSVGSQHPFSMFFKISATGIKKSFYY